MTKEFGNSFVENIKLNTITETKDKIKKLSSPDRSNLRELIYTSDLSPYKDAMNFDIKSPSNKLVDNKK